MQFTRLHRFRPRILDALSSYDRRRFGADVGAGITVGIVALPLAMAFAIASGVKPEQGLVTAVIAGFLIAALGGSHVQIGGPAGAFIVIVYGIVERYGLANLLIATSLAGVLMFLMGLFKLGALVRYVPVPIVIGFTNGIAVLIGLSQVKDFLGLETPKLPADFFSQIGVLARHAGTLNPSALAVAAASLAIVVLWPKSYKMPTAPTGLLARLRRLSAHLPGTIVALVAATVATVVLDLQVETIGSRFGGIPQALPSFGLPEFSWTTVKQLLIPTVTIALLGSIESLLCARVADNMAPLPRHDPNQELMAQGVANFVTPLFGGIPATGTIARTVTNVRAGAQTPVAGIVHSATVLAVVLLAAPLALHVPLAALAGILAFVAWNMGEWREFARLRHFSLAYRTILVGTFGLTVVFDLTVAVEVGLILACVFFIYRMSTLFRAEPRSEAGAPEGVQVVEVFGSLFFGAVAKIESLAQQPAGTRALVLEMHRLISMDTSGLDALAQLHRELQRQGVVLVLAEVNEQPLSLMRRAGFEAEIGAGNIVPTLADAFAAALAPQPVVSEAG
ncbi:sodium-independent anion transporter [Rubrivivax gelatinosus]|uniref:Sodium-independent anion transporter n=1 Tax=Rubrivivax gelatinosus TaxID=28068 RepID=A0ABS1DTW0_RUBGE|nr:SulP family inorganic anion transporter [Rubrivivax gelatinosus]MBK1614274.1 sodium-independent anion transporter [Rubrivivax gelatinosus]MBK1713436.1 sodium-independent anion transporter [Rubrivivax gelatinosus]